MSFPSLTSHDSWRVVFPCPDLEEYRGNYIGQPDGTPLNLTLRLTLTTPDDYPSGIRIEGVTMTVERFFNHLANQHNGGIKVRLKGLVKPLGHPDIRASLVWRSYADDDATVYLLSPTP